jgi:hypothetical protein
MSPEDLEKFRNAAKLYRRVWTEVLPQFGGEQTTEIQQRVDDLKEALLDLKQAVIQLDPALVNVIWPR